MVALTAARSRGRVDSSTTGIMVHVPFRVDIAIFHYGLLRSGHGHKIGTRLTALLRLTSCRILFRHILMMIVIPRIRVLPHRRRPLLACSGRSWSSGVGSTCGTKDNVPVHGRSGTGGLSVAWSFRMMCIVPSA